MVRGKGVKSVVVLGVVVLTVVFDSGVLEVVGESPTEGVISLVMFSVEIVVSFIIMVVVVDSGVVTISVKYKKHNKDETFYRVFT